MARDDPIEVTTAQRREPAEPIEDEREALWEHLAQAVAQREVTRRTNMSPQQPGLLDRILGRRRAVIGRILAHRPDPR